MSKTKFEVVRTYKQHVKHLICSRVQEDQQDLTQQNKGTLFPIHFDQNWPPKADRHVVKAT
jgi:hypothetical protein